jgi:hypothetical protein
MNSTTGITDEPLGCSAHVISEVVRMIVSAVHPELREGRVVYAS